MKKLTVLLFVAPAIFAASLVIYTFAIRVPPPEPVRTTVGQVRAEFVRAIEGEVIEVRITDYVRLIGVRVPKGEEGRADAARRFVEETLRGRTLVLRSDHLSPARDQYRLLLAYLEAPAADNRPAVDLNAELLRRGLGEVDADYEFTRRDEFQRLRGKAVPASR